MRNFHCLLQFAAISSGLLLAQSTVKSISTSPGVVHPGQTVDLIADGITLYQAFSVSFPMEDGGTKLALTHGGSVVVPHGSMSGSAVAVVYDSQQKPTISIPFDIAVLPQLRLHAVRNVLSSGELANITVLTPSSSRSWPISWRSDLGSIDARGSFQAPFVVNPAYARIWACLANTVQCDSVVVRVVPFRLDPGSVMLSPGESTVLGAWQGTGLISPVWRAVTANVKVLEDGTVTAGTGPFDGGSAIVSATHGGVTQTFTIAIAGPGTNSNAAEFSEYVRVSNFGDYIQLGSFAARVVTRRNWIYTLSYRVANPASYNGYLQAAWLDAYELDDRRQPVWQGSFEVPFSFSRYNQLVLEADQLTVLGIEETTGGPPSPLNTLVTYDIANGIPQLQRWSAFDGSPRAYRKLGRGWKVTSNSQRLALDLTLDDYSTNTSRQIPVRYAPLGERFSTSVNGGDGWAVILFDYVGFPRSEVVFFDTSGDAALPIAILPGPRLNGTGPLAIAGDIVFCEGFLYRFTGRDAELLFTGQNETAVSVDADSKRFLLSSFGYQANAGFSVLDMSDPTNPKRSGSTANLSNATAAALDRDYIAVAGGSPNLSISPISDSGVKILAPFSSSPPRYDLRIRDGLLFWTGRTLGFHGRRSTSGDVLEVVDISKTPPQVIKQLDRPGDQDGWAIELIGNFAYVGTDSETIVYDISQPRNPVVRIAISAPAISFALNGNILYAGSYAGNSKTILAYDVSSPGSPRLMSTIVVPEFAVSLSAANGLLAAALGKSGLSIYSILGSLPVLRQTLPGTYYGVAANGTMLYVAADTQGLLVFDVSSQLRLLSQTSLSSVADPRNGQRALAVFYDTRQIAWVSTSPEGRVYGLDLRQPLRPRIMAMMPTAPNTSAGAENSVVSDGMLVVAGSNAMFDVQQPQNVGLFDFDAPSYLDVLPLRTDGLSGSLSNGLDAEPISEPLKLRRLRSKLAGVSESDTTGKP